MNASSNALPPKDLSGSFTKPSRAAGLRLPGTRPTPAPAVQAVREAPEAPPAPVKAVESPQEPKKAPQAAQRPKKTSKAVREPQKAPQAAPAVAADLDLAGDSGILVLWTPVAIRDRMAAYKRETGITYLEQALRALDANAGNLAELLAEPEAPEVKVTTSALGLVHTQTPIVKAPKRVQLTIRGLIATNAKVIDDLARTYARESRSRLLNAVLDAWLPPAT